MAANPYPVHRSISGVIGASAWAVIALLFVADALRQHDRRSFGLVLVILAISGVTYLYAVRPRVEVNPEGLAVMNPLRDSRIPWVAVTHASLREAVVIELVDGSRLRCWSLPRQSAAWGAVRAGGFAGLPSRLPSYADASAAVAKRESGPQQIAADINLRAEAFEGARTRATPEEVMSSVVLRRWSPAALAVVALSALCVAGAIITLSG